MNNDYQPTDRRPLASRNTSWAAAISHWLAGKGISPNTISLWSMVFAALAAIMLGLISQMHGSGVRWLWLLVLAGIQLRLLANLFDGMVAVETHQASPLGELFNEVPDRVSDVLILLAWGLVPGSSMLLAVAASLLAVFVAYVRAIGASTGVGQVFAGIMSKPRRMFVLSVLCVLHLILPATWTQTAWVAGLGLDGLGLALIVIGCVITAYTRLRTIGERLQQSRSDT